MAKKCKLCTHDNKSFFDYCRGCHGVKNFNPSILKSLRLLVKGELKKALV
jgi:hypothetical protein